jgi:hypothetical protein
MDRIQALLASIMGANYGWRCSWIFGWLRIWRGRLSHGLRRVRHMAARNHTHPDDRADRQTQLMGDGPTSRATPESRLTRKPLP